MPRMMDLSAGAALREFYTEFPGFECKRGVARMSPAPTLPLIGSRGQIREGGHGLRNGCNSRLRRADVLCVLVDRRAAISGNSYDS